MSKYYYKVDTQKLQAGDIIWVNVHIVEAQGLNSVMLLAKVLIIRDRNSNSCKLEICFLNSDNSTIWVLPANCYYTSYNGE